MKKEEMTYLKKVTTQSVVQRVIDSLTDAMINRHLRPGDKIPTESELAESLGVGRNSIREAIKILVYLGVLEIRRAEGTFVCEGFSESMIDPMIYGIILDKEESYENLMELRELIEAGVMRLAMQKANAEDLEILKEKKNRLEKEILEGPDNIENIFQADNCFHDTISSMGKNPLVNKIDKVVRVLTYSMRFHSVKGMLDSGRGEELFEAHQKIYEMIEKHDVKDINEAVRNTYFTDVGMR
ncbi:MAG: FadR/GntR family transcriptional regulator [Blautia hansenii]|jgi:GntR family transcriptional repressor for pyruvate dehydrogenase complex